MSTTDSTFHSKSSTIINGILSQLQSHATKNHDINSKGQHPNYDNVFPSNHPFLFPKSHNTPLTAPESNLFTVADDYNYNANGGLIGSSGPDTTSLAWIIPTVIGIVAAMIIVGLLCFFGVRAMELKCLRFCQVNCGCCLEAGEETDVLTTKGTINQTEMTNYKSASTPDREQW